MTGQDHEERFRRFFEANCEQLVGLAFLWCGDREDALDIAQETLTRTWQRWNEVSVHPNPEAGLVAGLPRNPRRALVLHDVVGLSVEEIAVEMGAREGTVRSWLSRSRKTLRLQLAEDEHETGVL